MPAIYDETHLYPISPLSSPSAPARSPGLHASSIIRHIAQRNGWLDDEAELAAKFPPEQRKLLMSIGLAIEEWLGHLYERTLPDWHYHFGELEYGGIKGSPDGLQFVMRGGVWAPRICEIKATYESMGRSESGLGQNLVGGKYWARWAQLKTYAHMWMMGERTRDVTPGVVPDGVLIMFYIAGDYTMPIKPARRVFRQEFTRESLEENWRLVESGMGQVGQVGAE